MTNEIRYPVAQVRLTARENEYVNECLDTHWISSGGPYVKRFEDAFADYMGGGHAMAVSNGTMAIDLALHALGIGPHEEVIVPNLTFAATASPVYRIRAVPVIAPTGDDHWNMDANALSSLLTPKTRAIVAVHLYGVPCHIKEIAEFARQHGLKLIEDCAESIGATVDDQLTGTFGDVACFSFFGNKVVTTGEGGMCFTRDAEVAEQIRIYRDHGMSPTHRYWHRVIGYNGRMTNLQAAVGVAQLETLADNLSKRDQIHQQYQKHLSDPECFFEIKPPANSRCVTWLESPVLKPKLGFDRDRLLADLRTRGIDSRPFFFPISSMPAYNRFGYNDPRSTFFSGHGFNLPTYLDLTLDQVDEIGSATAELARQQLEANAGRNTTTLPLRTPTENEPAPPPPDVSIILPTYNEAKNAWRIVRDVRKEMVSAAKRYEILVMDDDSSDDTVAEITELFENDPLIQVTVRKSDRGLANSIYEGIRKARGEYVLVMDSDFNHDPAVTANLVRYAEDYDIVSGSRFTTGGGMQSRVRWWGSLVFNLYIRALLQLPTQDNLAGFYCIRRSKLHELPLDDIFHDYGDYFFRLLYHAHRRGFTILEIPVWYRDRDYGVSKTPFARTVCLYFYQAIRLRVRSWRRRFFGDKTARDDQAANLP